MVLPLYTSSGLIFSENEPFSLSLLKNLPGNPQRFGSRYKTAYYLLVDRHCYLHPHHLLSVACNIGGLPWWALAKAINFRSDLSKSFNLSCVGNSSYESPFLVIVTRWVSGRVKRLS
jgi:hypothetical protein